MAHAVPYPKMCLAVLEWATSLNRLVLLTVLGVGLLESMAELNPNLDQCLLSGKVKCV